ncbi:MAG: hypothetical protein JW818_15415 [Pirellulales bacterium]|nr:hypothetical protein [Pirellulales bacterium]
MPENPYQSPAFVEETAAAEPVSRRRAKRAFRKAAAVLLAPAIYNLCAFEAHVHDSIRPEAAPVMHFFDVLGFVIACGLIWLLGLTALESVSFILFSAFARKTDPTAWQEVLYRSFDRAVYLTAAGAVLWGVWVFCFYQMDCDFQLISWAIGIPAHLLAACWYVPLIYRWYQLATADRSNSSAISGS